VAGNTILAGAESTGAVFTLDKSLPEWPSPAVFTVDPQPFVTTPFGTGINFSGVPKFHVDGATITEVFVSNEGGGYFTLKFCIGLRRGGDADGTVTYELVTGERVIATGQVGPENIDEHTVTILSKRVRVKKADLQELRAAGGTFRISLAIR